MPSVSSISAVLDKGSNHKEQVEKNLDPFPSIDPLDAFYLLNPDGDLSGTQIEFENYFRGQNLEVFDLFAFDKEYKGRNITDICIPDNCFIHNLVNICLVFPSCYFTGKGRF